MISCSRAPRKRICRQHKLHATNKKNALTTIKPDDAESAMTYGFSPAHGAQSRRRWKMKLIGENDEMQQVASIMYTQ